VALGCTSPYKAAAAHVNNNAEKQAKHGGGFVEGMTSGHGLIGGAERT